MDEEFEEFFESQIRKMHTGYSGMKAAWLEATRRADRKAREECAEIAKSHASCEGIAQSIEYEIRATIKEEQ